MGESAPWLNWKMVEFESKKTTEKDVVLEMEPYLEVWVVARSVKDLLKVVMREGEMVGGG